MSIKDLFNRSSQVVVSSSLKQLAEDAESPEYISEYVEDQNRVEPHIDFSKPENFAKYGSAEEYYSKSLEYINCGHPHPLIAYNDKIVTLDKGSTVLGMFPQLPEIKISKLKTSKGFDLFSYTDGLIEIQNAYGDYYGSSKIKSLFESGRKEPEEFIELVKEDVNNFKGNNISLDDTTLLMISVKNV